MEELLQTTLCYLERDGQYLMLHRVKKSHDVSSPFIRPAARAHGMIIL